MEEYDVFIAGAGIIASTFARILVEEGGLRVLMVDAGAQHSRLPGENLKNFPNFQRDVDQFGGIVRGLMHPASIAPVNNQAEYTRNALNPHQDAAKNLPGAVISYAVGGMAIHWTCAIPRHEEIERLAEEIIPREELDKLYEQAEKLLDLHTDVHESSLRHQELKKVLGEYEVENTPLAARRMNKEYVHYTGADTVLGDLAEPGQGKTLTLLQEHRVTKLHCEQGADGAKKAVSAELRDLRSGEDKVVRAKVFVVAAGWVHTAQILWTSGIQAGEDSALGCFLTDHTFVACQVVLKEEIVQAIGRRAEEDPDTIKYDSAPALSIPMKDPPPHLHIRVSEKHPWHAQIFREAFQVDPLTPTIDSRLIVDLKWFGMVQPVKTNRVRFEPKISDRMGMPQPTFEFTLGAGDLEQEERMMQHMLEVAGKLGEILSGENSMARRIPLGASTHTMGATRMGKENDSNSVVDPDSKVWGCENVYVGGNCVIPVANASNPTLTSVALAIKAANRILNGLKTV